VGQAEKDSAVRDVWPDVVGELDESAALSLVRRGCAIRELRRATVKSFDFSVARRFAIAFSAKAEKWRPIWLQDVRSQVCAMETIGENGNDEEGR